MAKPLPHQLDSQRYPHRHLVPTRFSDLDPNNHINNVALAGIIEDGRVRLHRDAGWYDPELGVQIMLASLTVEYLAQSHYPLDITVLSGVGRVGRSSLDVEQLVMQEGLCVAYARSVVVFVEDGAAVPLPGDVLARLDRWKLTQ